jgi:hypothetical protein
VNKVVKMRHYAVAVIACSGALVVARPLTAAFSCFLLAIIVQQSLRRPWAGSCSPLDFLQSCLNVSSLSALERSILLFATWGISRHSDHGESTDRSQEAHRGHIAPHTDAAFASNTDRSP